MIGRIALGAVMLAALGTAVPVQAKEIRLGFMTPLSGPLTFLGREQEMGMQLALEQLGNKLGGIPVKVFKQDGRMSAATANQAVTKLMEQDKIDILTGLLLSNQTIAITKPVADRGIFVISGVSGPKPIAGSKCHPNFFNISWQNEQPSEALGKWLTARKVDNVYAISQNYVAGRDHVAGVWYHYKGKRGGEIYVSRRHSDYSGEIARIRAANPSAVFMFLPGRGGIAFLKQMAGAGAARQNQGLRRFLGRRRAFLQGGRRCRARRGTVESVVGAARQSDQQGLRCRIPEEVRPHPGVLRRLHV